MISWLLLILPVAVLFYGILPTVFNFFYRKILLRRISILQREGISSGVHTCVSGFSGGKLVLESSSGSLISVSPSSMVFFLVDGKCPKKIPWRLFLSLPRGLEAFYIPPAGFKSPAEIKYSGKHKIPGSPRIVRRRGMCVLFNPSPSGSGARSLPELSVPARAESPAKPFLIASGAFIEFIFFLFFIRHGENFAAALTALAAVFGRAIPYCPPGLFFTLASASMLSGKPDLKLPAVAVKITGVAVNIIAFLLIVGNFIPLS